MRGPVLYAVTWIALTCAGAPGASASVPLEVYGRLPSLEDVALSPDGARIAFVRTRQDTRFIAIISLADSKVLGALRLRQEKLRKIEWADDNHIMIVTSATALPAGFVGSENEWQLLQVYDVRSHKAVPVPDPLAITTARMMNVINGRVMVRNLGGHTCLLYTSPSPRDCS